MSISPVGTTEKNFIFQPSLRDSTRCLSFPALKRRAIFKMSLWDTVFPVIQKLRFTSHSVFPPDPALNLDELNLHPKIFRRVRRRVD